MKVVIIGAGLGGLACAIACRREGLEVELLERAPEIAEIGAGIQIPPNGTRVCRYLGVLPRLASIASSLETIDLRRYATGEVLHERKLGSIALCRYEAPWMVIHRADYQMILLNRAIALGANVRLGAEAVDIDFEKTQVVLLDGSIVTGDVIVGADGLWSSARDKLLGHPSPPSETGDLAYRGTFTKAQLLALNDARVEELCYKSTVTVWLGPEKHAVFYPLKGGQQFNLVLLRPDNLPPSVRAERGSLEEMRDTFEGWDPILRKIISCIPSVLKWKLCHHETLETWTKANVCLLGDACHPTLPYQAQGAAMAVEDGAVLGKLLGLLNSEQSSNNVTSASVSDVLKLYESLRKDRTTTIVQGAVSNRKMYHLPDGAEQEKRDLSLKMADWIGPNEWNWADPEKQRALLGFNAIGNAERAFEKWIKSRQPMSAVRL